MDLSRLGQTSQTGDQDSSVGTETTPKLVCQRNNTAIYRLKDEGIKVLVDPNPTEEQILKLVHERTISKYLPPTCRKRHVSDVKGYRGELAVYFQWTRGKTLTEWLHKARQQSDVNLNVRLQVAIAIVETLCDFHDEGVVYNNLSPNNIVLDTSEGSYVATLIDLSEASIFYNKGEEFARKVEETDLKCLGMVLNELFHYGEDFSYDQGDEEMDEYRNTGQTNEERKEDPSMRKKRGKHKSLGEGLPMYLGTLISTLLLSGEDATHSYSQTRYECAKDFLLDLRVVEKNPEKFLKHRVVDDFLAPGRLQLPADAAFGRQSEISMLLHALSSVMESEGQPMMVSITGLPGTGKTTLANQIRKPLQNAGGCIVGGKFNVRARSDSVIFSALDTFYSDIIQGGREGIQQEMRSRILERVGLGCMVLAKSIPSLQSFLGEYYHENKDTRFHPGERDQRWKHLLCKLVAATSNKGCPLVIFLDDLQWADESSLDVIRMMVTDPDIAYCLFVGVYRDNESSATQRLKKLLCGIQEQGVSVMSMGIGPIEKESVNTILSETLCLPPRLCQSLSTTIHNKTGGIALFVINFLESLNEEGLLWFNLSSRRWEFDIRGIELKEISEEVVEYMTDRMTRLPHQMQSGLKISACLGSKFDACTLQKGFPENNDVHEFLRFAVEGGYLQNSSSGKYVFAHDEIQQAAYELIPETKQSSFHLLLGSRIYLRTAPADLNDDLFTIVGNMNIGAHLMKSQQQKLAVARLNLKAGEMALASSSFNSAAKYLMLGIKLLPDDSWAEEYDLTIKLYDAATEANYVTGDFDTLSTIIQTPLLHASSFEDKLRTYRILVRYLIASAQLREAVSKSRNILAHLGEILPEDVDRNFFTEEQNCVKQSLIDLSEDDLLGLPLMTDESKLSRMQFLSLSLFAAYYVAPLLAPILIFRMVRLSIDHGVCNISTFAFSSYGSWLVSPVKSDFENGYRMGRLAVTLMKILEANEFIPRVYSMVYGFINFWKEPFQAGLAKHLQGYEAGVLSGDIEYAVGCLCRYVMCALFNCGEDLVMLEKSARLYIRRSIQCKQHMPARILVVAYGLIHKLMGSAGSSDFTLVESQEATEYQQSSFFAQFNLLERKFLAFFNGEMDEAAELFEMGAESYSDTTPLPSHFFSGKLIDGLIAFFFARAHKEDENRWQNIGEAIIDLAREWTRNSNWNFSNKLYLLEAEYFFFKNDEPNALAKYDQSIKAAHAHHFIHEEGLAFERAARFHLHYGRNVEAIVCFNQSKKCYKNWGAHSLVNYIEAAIASC